MSDEKPDNGAAHAEDLARLEKLVTTLTREQKTAMLGTLMCNGYRREGQALFDVVRGGASLFVNRAMRVDTQGLQRGDYRAIFKRLKALAVEMGYGAPVH